jgi:TadE-like protein
VVEAVIVVPVLMFVLMVIVQFCLWMHATQVAQLAASEGDRVARSLGGGPAAGDASAQSILNGPGSDVTGSSVVVSVLPGNSEWLQVTGQATSIVPGLSFTVTASANGPIQQFRGSE